MNVFRARRKMVQSFNFGLLGLKSGLVSSRKQGGPGYSLFLLFLRDQKDPCPAHDPSRHGEKRTYQKIESSRIVSPRARVEHTNKHGILVHFNE